MSKHRKYSPAETSETRLVAKAGSPPTETRPTNDNNRLPNDRKKQVSGVWALIVIFGLLFLLLFFEWLTN